MKSSTLPLQLEAGSSAEEVDKPVGVSIWPTPFVRRLALLVIVMVMLSATLSATWVLRVVDQAALEQLSARQTDEMDTLAAVLASKIEQSQKVLRTLARDLSPTLMESPGTLAWLIENGWAAVQWFDALVVLRSGGELQLFLRDGQLHPASTLTAGERDALRRTLIEGKPQVIELSASSDAEDPKVLFTVPVLRQDGVVQGVVAGVLRLHSQSVLPSTLFSPGRSESKLIVFSRDGVILAQNDEQRALGDITQEPSLLSVASRWLNSGQGGALPRQAVTENVRESLVTVAAIPLPQWMVARVTDTRTALALGTETRGVVLATLVGGALVLALLGGLAVVLLARPLARVQAQARERAEGVRAADSPTGGRAQQEYSSSVSPLASAVPNGADDIEQLAHDIEQLAQRVGMESQQGQLAKQQWSALLETACPGVITLQWTTVEHGSWQAAQVLGYASRQLRGLKTQALFSSAQEYTEVKRRIARSFRAHGAFDGELRVRRQDGSAVWLHLKGRSVAGTVIRTLWQIEDLGMRHAVQRTPGWRLLHDPLTQLPNRKGFIQRLQHWLTPDPLPEVSVHASLVHRQRPAASPAMAAAMLHDSQVAGVLLFMDVDYLALINDQVGHPAGDDALCRLARMLELLVGQSGWSARLGGDEFAVVLPGCSGKHGWQIAEQIRTAVQDWEPVYQRRRFALSVSIGLVTLYPQHHTMSEMLRAADMACYEAKRTGRNRVVQHPYPPAFGES